MKKPRSAQRGFSGMLVLAAIVLFGGMAVYGVSMVTSVHTGFTQELNVARAKQAANAGLEWAKYQVKIPAAANCPAAQNLAMPATLAAYTVTVTCTDWGSFQEVSPDPAVRIYRVTATACNMPGATGCPNTAASTADYVEKQMIAWVKR